uniref:Uncharacterized protein n=1 Tax=Oryza rufipogon TaxID=4529 RepID=A0A0E0PL08_ORYRU
MTVGSTCQSHFLHLYPFLSGVSLFSKVQEQTDAREDERERSVAADPPSRAPTPLPPIRGDGAQPPIPIRFCYSIGLCHAPPRGSPVSAMPSDVPVMVLLPSWLHLRFVYDVLTAAVVTAEAGTLRAGTMSTGASSPESWLSVKTRQL